MAGARSGDEPPRKVMVVADPTRESAAALEYALRHAVIENDTLILLHCENPNAWKNPFNSIFNRTLSINPQGVGQAPSNAFKAAPGAQEVDFMEAMKQATEIAQPKIKIHAEKVELCGKDKAAAILSLSKAHEVDTLVIGQRRTLSSAILGQRKNGSRMRSQDTAEFLIANSKCTCVGVQKKGPMGGYVLNSKTHKNFWLLA